MRQSIQTLETNCRPASPLDAAWQLGRAVGARPFTGGSRSAILLADIQPHTTMKRLSRILLLLLSCGVAFGTTVDFRKYVQVTPTNATEHGIKFFYHAPIPALVSVEMPFAKGEQTFDEAILEFTSAQQHFKIPVQGKKQEGDRLLIAFWMDRNTLRESSLKIQFSKRVDIKPTVYVFSLKDFVPKEEPVPVK
jgi:hypothetical protein